MTDDIPKKKKVLGKQKGNTFERRIANMLSARFAELLGKETSFRRSTDSGAFFGGTNSYRTEKYDLDHAIFGDLICPNSFLYSVECKHYKTPPSFQSVISHDVKQWDKWIAQADQDSEKSNKKMLLVIKYNNVDEIVFVNESFPIISSAFTYKEKHVYKLVDFLTLSDTTFFIL